MTDPFEASMAKLAAAIALKASEKETSLTESIDALKALTPYLALQLKKNGSKTSETGDESSFADFRVEIDGAGRSLGGVDRNAAEINGVQDVTNGGPTKAVRGRRRRSAHA